MPQIVSSENRYYSIHKKFDSLKFAKFIQEDNFFIALKKQDKNKWKKAVSLLYTRLTN